MAEKTKNDNSQAENNENISASGQQNKGSNNLVLAILAFITAVLIIGISAAGISYYVVSKNVNGITDKYKDKIEGIPILKMALPKPLDPGAPEYLTPEEITKRYQSLREEKAQNNKKLQELNKKEAQIQKLQADMEQLKSDNVKLQQDAEKEKKKLKDDNTKLMEELKDASGSTAEVSDALLGDSKEFAKIYETMDSAAAAKIFEQMGEAKITLVVNIIKNMKKDAQAGVLAAMTPKFASSVSEKMSKKYITAQSPQPTPGQ